MCVYCGLEQAAPFLLVMLEAIKGFFFVKARRA